MPGVWDAVSGYARHGLTLPRLKPGDSRRTHMATHHVSPRRACPARLDVASIARRRFSTGSRSSGWHPFQLRSCFYPSERLSLEPSETRLDWQGASVLPTILALGRESSKPGGPFIPRRQAGGFLAHFL